MARAGVVAVAVAVLVIIIVVGVVLVIILVVGVPLTPLPVVGVGVAPLALGEDHHIQTGRPADAARPVSRGSFRQSRSSLSRSSSG